jgi:hypothetical protein
MLTEGLFIRVDGRARRRGFGPAGGSSPRMTSSRGRQAAPSQVYHFCIVEPHNSIGRNGYPLSSIEPSLHALALAGIDVNSFKRSLNGEVVRAYSIQLRTHSLQLFIGSSQPNADHHPARGR